MNENEPKSLAERCVSAFEVLDASATFAMSLGAKELFHTNFLGFLLETEDPTLDELRTKIREALGFPVAADEVTTCAVWREKLHLDLIIVPLLKPADPLDRLRPSDSRALILEAKLKSLPTVEQLRRYDDLLVTGFRVKFPDDDSPEWTARIGGVPTRVNPDPISPKKVLLLPRREKILDGWESRTWSGIAMAILDALGTSRGTRLREIIGDYADSLVALLKIVNAGCETFESQWANRATATYTQMYAMVDHKDFANRRLRDLVSKVVYDAWMRKQLALLAPADLPAGVAFCHYVHYSNAQPGLGFEYLKSYGEKLDRLMRIGVQIQGGQFRCYVSTSEVEPNLEQFVMHEGNLLLEQWLKQEICGRQLLGLLDRPVGRQGAKDGRASNLRVFDAKRFLFSAFKIDDAMTLAEIAESVKNSLQVAHRLMLRLETTQLQI